MASASIASRSHAGSGVRAAAAGGASGAAPPPRLWRSAREGGGGMPSGGTKIRYARSSTTNSWDSSHACPRPRPRPRCGSAGAARAPREGWGGRTRGKGTRRVQLVRRDGRDVSTLYGREGGGVAPRRQRGGAGIGRRTAPRGPAREPKRRWRIRHVRFVRAGERSAPEVYGRVDRGGGWGKAARNLFVCLVEPQPERAPPRAPCNLLTHLHAPARRPVSAPHPPPYCCPYPCPYRTLPTPIARQERLLPWASRGGTA